MANIHIRRKHNLDNTEAKARVEEIAKDLKGKLGASYRWEGDSLRFKRTGASGSIEVGQGEIEVNVTLGLVLMPMKGVIESTINKGFDSALADSGESKIA